MSEQERIKLAQADVDNIHNAWKVFTHERLNGSHDEIHLAPALISCGGYIFEDLIGLSYGSHDVVINEDAMNVISTYGAAMFAFGQRAARDGVLVANMVQCNCCEVTDEEIKEFLN